jgi:hypothetical protein
MSFPFFLSVRLTAEEHQKIAQEAARADISLSDAGRIAMGLEAIGFTRGNRRLTNTAKVKVNPSACLTLPVADAPAPRAEDGVVCPLCGGKLKPIKELVLEE